MTEAEERNRCPQCGTFQPSPWHVGTDKPEKEGEYVVMLQWDSPERGYVSSTDRWNGEVWEEFCGHNEIAWFMAIPPLPEVSQ